MLKSLSSLFKSTPHANKTQREIFDFLNLIKKWPQIVGPSMSKHTIPLKLKNNCLYILSNHSAFSGAVSFMEEAIKKKITEAFPAIAGSVKRLNFQVNSRTFNQEVTAKKHILKATKPSGPALHPYSPKYQSLLKLAQTELQEIDDPEVKELLTSIYIQTNSNK